VLSGSALVKTVHRMLMKLTLGREQNISGGPHPGPRNTRFNESTQTNRWENKLMSHSHTHIHRHTHTHTHTHTLSLSLTLTLTLAISFTTTYSLSLALFLISLSFYHIHTNMHILSLFLSHIHTLTQSFSLSSTYKSGKYHFRDKRGERKRGEQFSEEYFGIIWSSLFYFSFLFITEDNENPLENSITILENNYSNS